MLRLGADAAVLGSKKDLRVKWGSELGKRRCARDARWKIDAIERIEDTPWILHNVCLQVRDFPLTDYIPGACVS